MTDPDWLQTWTKLDSDAQCVRAILLLAAFAAAAGALFYLALDWIVGRIA